MSTESAPEQGIDLDEVTDLIANIEMHRREIERESGSAVARDYSLRRLNAALQGAQEGSELHGASAAARAANIDALTAEIRRIQTLQGSGTPRPAVKGRGGPGPAPRRNPQPTSSRSRNRRRMGRHTGR